MKRSPLIRRSFVRVLQLVIIAVVLASSPVVSDGCKQTAQLLQSAGIQKRMRDAEVPKLTAGLLSRSADRIVHQGVIEMEVF